MSIPVKYSFFFLFFSGFAVSAPDRVLSACDLASEWNGGTVDAATKKEGTASIEWRHGDNSQLSFNASYPLDLSTHESLGFWLHSNADRDHGFILILESENQSTSGMDYYMYPLKANFSGWKYFLVKRSIFGVSREPLGWDRIGNIYFTASGWGNEPDPSIIIHVDDVRMTDSVITGPLLSKADFFQMINPDYPGLESFKAALNVGNTVEAEKELAAYYRSRTSVSWEFDPHNINPDISFSQSTADNAVNGSVSVIGIPYTFPGGEIDWHYNITFERSDLSDNAEWQWQLNRMSFWIQLGRAYWATGDEKYALAFKNQLRSWIKQCPRPETSGNTTGSAWRTIETGIRLSGCWAECWHRFLHSPSLTDEDLIYFLISITEQALHLQENQTSGNWVSHEMDGLYTAGGLFPEITLSRQWRSFAAAKMKEEIDKQFMPDGAQIELTTHYHMITLDHSLSLYQRAELFGRIGELPFGYLDKLEKGYEYAVLLMAPDRTLPKFNDSGTETLPDRMRDVIAYFPLRKDFAWVVSDGAEGEPPSVTSVKFRYAGYCAMRTGWEKDANYLVLDGGMFGYGHVHFDKLNLVLWSYGREILYDGGGGQYENSKWREYAISTYSHNTVIVDGLPQIADLSDRWSNVPSAPLPIAWESSEAYDFAAAEYSGGYGSTDNRIARHKREVLFIKPALALVADYCIPADQASHTYEARWHVKTVNTTMNSPLKLVATDDNNLSNLAIVPLFRDRVEVTAVSGQESPDIRGWLVAKSGSNQRTTTVGHMISGTGPRSMLTLLQPVQAGGTHSVAAITSTSGLSADVLFSDNARLTATLKSDTGSGMTVRTFLPSGQGDRIIDINPDYTVPVVPETGEAAGPGILIHMGKQRNNHVLYVRNVTDKSELLLLTLQGRLVHRQDLKGEEDCTVYLDDYNLQDGLYLAAVHTAGGPSVSGLFYFHR